MLIEEWALMFHKCHNFHFVFEQVHFSCNKNEEISIYERMSFISLCFCKTTQKLFYCELVVSPWQCSTCTKHKYKKAHFLHMAVFRPVVPCSTLAAWWYFKEHTASKPLAYSQNTIWYNSPEDHHLHKHHHQNLKSHWSFYTVTLVTGLGKNCLFRSNIIHLKSTKETKPQQSMWPTWDSNWQPSKTSQKYYHFSQLTWFDIRWR
jgi:hypothetical protein